MWTRVTLASAIALFHAATSLAASNVTSIDFKMEGSTGLIEIRADGPVTFDKQDNEQDKQIVLELKDVKLAEAAARKLDTSSFPGEVSLVSPYQVEGQTDTARVVIQLRSNVATNIVQEGNLIRISVPSATSSDVASGAQAPSPENPSAPTIEAQDPPPGALNESLAATPAATPEPVAITSAIGGDQQSKLDEFMKTRETKQFTGKPVTLQLREADVVEVLRLIGDISGFNILVGDDVRGRITLSLKEVPWDQALDVILHTLHLGAERNNNLLRVVTLSNLTAEKTQELQAKAAIEANAPRVTRVFPISYADPSALQTILSSFGSQRSGMIGEGAMIAQAGTVMVDPRTNSIVVQDLPGNIERMRKLIEILDTQTPQVMIEAKIVEATENFARNIGGNLGIGTSSQGFISSFAGGNPVDPLVGSPGVFADGGAIGTQTAGGGLFGISPGLFLGGRSLARINAILNLGEEESQVKVVSAPKTVVLNKKSASIIQGTPVLVAQTQVVPGVGPLTTTTPQSANLSLSVTPTVTNDGRVLMNLNIQKDVPLSNLVANRSMNTEVLVESGSTLVIGGIYTMQNEEKSRGFPWLRKIPILGYFFGSTSSSTSKSELFIFITPRILNQKEAGITS